MTDEIKRIDPVLESTSAARHASLSAVFSILLTQGPVSRAELARRTGLSKQTMSEIARFLEDAGWIQLCGQTQGALGRRALTYRLDPRSALVIGIDLGGTKVRLAVADLLGNVLGALTRPTDRRGGPAVIAQISDMAAALAQDLGIDRARIRCGVMGSPGVFQPRGGMIRLAPNIPGFDSMDVASALHQALGVPVAIENDVNLAALGEMKNGAPPNMVFIALGTGIGMGIVADGQLLRGARGSAGEIAYLPLGGDPFDARGFRLGTLESAIGSAAIAERFRALGGDASRDVRGIFDRLQEGDAAAAITLDEVARILTQAIMAIGAVLDPECIVFGGSIGAREELVARVRQLAATFIGDHLQIRASALGTDAVLAGAIGLALSQLHERLFDAGRQAVSWTSEPSAGQRSDARVA